MFRPMAADLGNVPEWIGACGTALALLFAAFSYGYDRHRGREERRAEQAHLFDAWVTEVQPTTVSLEDHGEEALGITVHLSNASSRSFRGVTLNFVVGSETCAPVDVHVVPPTGVRSVEMQLAVPLPVGIDVGLRSRHLVGMTKVAMSFTDASGNRWHRTGDGDLRFLYNLSARAKQNQAGQSDIPKLDQ
jgi:hypothetical protein